MTNRKTPRGGKEWALRGLFHAAKYEAALLDPRVEEHVRVVSAAPGVLHGIIDLHRDCQQGRAGVREWWSRNALAAGATEAEINAVITQARGVKRD